MTTTTGRGDATTFTTPTDRELAMTRHFEAPRARVWEAWTRPEHVSRWMLGPEGWNMPVCDMDLRPEGAWHYLWRREDGTEMGMRGVYREVAPPGSLVSTETWGGDWPETLNTVTLVEDGGGTTMTLTVHYPSAEAREAATATGMKEGVAQSFDRLADHLRSLG